LKLLRGRYSFLILLTATLFGLILGFQNCAPSDTRKQITESDDGIVRKIEIESGAPSLVLFDAGAISEQGQKLMDALPTDRPLVVLVRNGYLYPDVQLVVNGKSYFVSEYLDLLNLFSVQNPSVPIFHSPAGNGHLDKPPLLEQLQNIRIEFGPGTDPSRFCEQIINSEQDKLESDLIIQIADATGILEGQSNKVSTVYWTLPLRIFTAASCGSS